MSGEANCAKTRTDIRMQSHRQQSKKLSPLFVGERPNVGVQRMGKAMLFASPLARFFENYQFRFSSGFGHLSSSAHMNPMICIPLISKPAASSTKS